MFFDRNNTNSMKLKGNNINGNFKFIFSLRSLMHDFNWGHPYSTYAQRGRGGVKPNAYDCVQSGRGFSRLRTYAKKIFFGPQNKNFSFFVQKKLLHYHLLLCIEKCKLTLSYK